MKKLKTGLLITLSCVMLALSAAANAAPCPTGQYKIVGDVCSKPTPAQGLQLLLDGNAKFVAGVGNTHLDDFVVPAVRSEVATGQKPFAVVLTCSDSRLPPEILFDQGLGEIFVVRVAGNIVNPHELGSIEYALEHLGANLIVVLGHSKCGAVKTTYDVHGTDTSALGPNLNSLISSIDPAVTAVLTAEGGKAVGTAAQAVQVEACVVENVNLVAESLGTRSTIIEEKKVAGDIQVVRAKYDLGTGAVSVLP
jgi:carbonic anhydrase